MMITKCLNFARIITPILICSLIISCSASTHYGVTTVAEPPKQESDVNKWFLYYQDQFDATSGKVSSPSEEYPIQAKEGYQKALENWKTKVKDKSSISTPIVVGLVIISIYLIAKLLKPSMNSNGLGPWS